MNSAIGNGRARPVALMRRRQYSPRDERKPRCVVELRPFDTPYFARGTTILVVSVVVIMMQKVISPAGAVVSNVDVGTFMT